MRPAIRVENLGKCYQVARTAERTPYRTLRESLTNLVKAPLRRLRNSGSDGEVEPFWALRDVNFEVQPGEVVGIIGRNGAGKSTLLKILSRITRPTTGRVELNGRVGSLLEVGTGFHPELTGRENIYLNGSILGMSRREIARRFDEIVAFAEVEQFLDTPVKRYSSGMYVRLAFAVAAHLEPEMLIVDEVLAVGDAQFQKKCLGKMGDLANCGRTILFVTHQMGAVQALCTHAMMLDGGRVRNSGSKEKVIAEYLAMSAPSNPPASWIAVNEGRTRGRAWFTGVAYSSKESRTDYHLFPDGPAEFMLEMTAQVEINPVFFSVGIYDRYDTPLVLADVVRMDETYLLRRGRNRFCLTIKSLHLNPGDYRLALWMADPTDVLDWVPSVATLSVKEYKTDPEVRRSGSDGVVTNQFVVQTMPTTLLDKNESVFGG